MASTDQQLASAKRKAWVVLKAHNSIWQSSVGREYKRQLCYALVEPILTYSAKSWPLTAAQERRLDETFSRMLRFAIGLQPAYVSRNECHTEDLYDGRPFISALVMKRRISMLGHMTREHVAGVRFHPLVTVLLWDFSSCKQKRHVKTLREQIFHESRTAFPEPQSS